MVLCDWELKRIAKVAFLSNVTEHLHRDVSMFTSTQTFEQKIMRTVILGKGGGEEIFAN